MEIILDKGWKVIGDWIFDEFGRKVSVQELKLRRNVADEVEKAKRAEYARRKYAEDRKNGAPAREGGVKQPCARCGLIMRVHSHGSAEEPMHKTCRKQATIEKNTITCPTCEQDFVARTSKAKFCSIMCVKYTNRNSSVMGRVPGGQTEAEKSRRRRARLLGRACEAYTSNEIAERDDYTCQLCGLPVDMALAGRREDMTFDPMSPSIDHKLPISKGGNDTKANVQLAHLVCNVSKGNRHG